MTTKIPRGIRLNNPGNIRHSKDNWQGKSTSQPDKDFIRFDAPKWGIRALARVLIKYYDHNNLNTIRKIITRWAPPVENDTKAYASSVAKDTGIGVDEVITLHSYEHMFPIVKAIIKHENGRQPYDDATINLALVMAGIEAPKKPLIQSKTLQSGKVSTVAISAAGASEAATKALEAHDTLSPYASTFQIIQYVCLGLALFAVGFMMYSRIKDDDKRIA